MTEAAATGPERDGGATITPYPDGPYLVRGTFTLRDVDGDEIEPRRRVVALCRCGRSRIKPFCDGTHTAARFQAGSCSASSPATSGVPEGG
jgi:CDGSH-type Zn-finger protein